MSHGKVSIGAAVECPAEKIIGKKRARNLGVQDGLLQGTVVGSGAGRKWQVQWSLPDGSFEQNEHGARILSLKNSASNVPNRAPENLRGEDEDMEGSSSDEASDNGGLYASSDMDTSSDEEYILPSSQNLNVNGLQWMKEPKGISDNWRAQQGYTAQEKPRLIWSVLGRERVGLQKPSRLDYFELFMPDILDLVVSETNRNLSNHHEKLTSKHEIMKTIGVIYALGLGGKRTRRDNWAAPSECIYPPAQFGERFGLPYHRFENLLNYWQWYESGSEWDDPSDDWRHVRYFQYKFNERVKQVFVPGFIICIDESTIRWYGFEDWHTQGCPHVTKIARKPENISVEVRCAADGQWEICIWIEIQEGAVAMAKKKYVCENRNAGTACILRATEAWFGQGKIVVADSAFASVATSVELHKNKVYFIGMVKTARKSFPKTYLQNVFMEYRGETLAVSAVKEGVELMAVAWNEPAKVGKPRKTLISTCGTTLPADACKRLRYKENAVTGMMEPYLREVPISQVASMYFGSAGAIDHFNRIRQDGIRIERNLEFRIWHKRVLTSLLGFVGANAYKAYQGEGGTEGVSDFMEGLALEMLQNKLEGYV